MRRIMQIMLHDLVPTRDRLLAAVAAVVLIGIMVAYTAGLFAVGWLVEAFSGIPADLVVILLSVAGVLISRIWIWIASARQRAAKFGRGES